MPDHEATISADPATSTIYASNTSRLLGLGALALNLRVTQAVIVLGLATKEATGQARSRSPISLDSRRTV